MLAINIILQKLQKYKSNVDALIIFKTAVLDPNYGFTVAVYVHFVYHYALSCTNYVTVYAEIGRKICFEKINEHLKLVRVHMIKFQIFT